MRDIVLFLASELEDRYKLESHFSPPFEKLNKGRKLFTLVLVAAIFVVVGIIIASQLDLTPLSNARAPIALAKYGAYPVVEVDGEQQSPFVSVVDKVQEAVVNISARSRESTEVPWWHQRRPSASSSGSGFFFRDDGYILTNNHVVQNAANLTVTTASGYHYEAKLVGADQQTDLAVLKIDPEEEITVIPFGDSDELKVGEWAIAIGNPFPQQGLDRTVTVGVISAKGRSNLNFGRETPAYQNYIQTDASINPGNSGGPLLNLSGEVIGVNAAISSPTGGSVGIGFAIPINLARSVVPDLIATGTVARGWLGVWLGELTEQEARRQGLDAVRGVKIDSVFGDSPAARAGIKKNDIILSLDGQPVNNNSQLSVFVSQTKSGTPIDVELVRDGERFRVKAVMADRDLSLASMQERSDDFASVQWLGMELMTFTDEIAQAIGAEHVDGVYVRRVYPGSPADNSSITRGAVILQVDKEPVKTIEDLVSISRSLQGSSGRVPVIIVEPDGTIARKVIRP